MASTAASAGGPAGPDVGANEEVVLDGNELAKGHAFFSVGDTDISDDGRWLAYTTDTKGFRQYTLRIKDLETGETLAGEVERVGSVVWAADNRTLFYTVEDEQQKRQYQVWRYALGSEHAADALVFQDDDERFNLAAGRTRDGKYIVVESASHTTSEARVLRADQPAGSFDLIAPREDEHEYSIDHRNGLWYIRTNDRGRNFRLVTAPVATPGREHWTERIAHRDAVMLEDVDLFAGFFIACEREDGLPRLRLWRFAGDGADAASAGEIAFPEPAYSAHPHINRIFEATTFRYAYQSLVTPSSVYEYDVATGRIDSPKAVGDSRRLRPHALRERADSCNGSRWGQGSRFDCVSQGHARAWEESAVCVRLRILWLLAAVGLQFEPSEPAGSRRGDGLCAYSRRRRHGRALARCRKNAGKAQYVYATSLPAWNI